VYKIPAKVTDPADVWSYANLHATSDLTNRTRFGTGLLSPNNSVIHDDVCLFTAAKYSAATAKDVGRKSCALNGVAQCQGAQHRAEGAVFMSGMDVKNAIIEIDKDILKSTPGVHGPSFNTDTKIPVKKVLKINPASESVIRFEVTVILP